MRCHRHQTLPFKLSFVAVFFVMLAALAVIGAASGYAADRSLVITEDADYFGRDYDILKDVELEACKSACLGNEECVAFTYNTSAKWCFLKADFGDLRAFAGAVSGRIVTVDAPKPSVEKERAAELGFLPKGMVEGAKTFVASLSRHYEPGSRSYGQLIDAAEGQKLSGDQEGAAALFGAALTVSPDSRSLWVRFTEALIASNPSDWQVKRQTEEFGSGAAINAYLKSSDEAERAGSLFLLGKALEKRRIWREAIRSYRASLQLVDDKMVRAAYDAVVAQHGFRVVSHEVDSDAAAPRICLVFAYPLPAERDGLVDYLSVRGGSGLSKEAEERQICVDGVEHGKRYQLTLRPGLPSADGEKIEKAVNLDIYVRDRSPAVRFTGRSYVLPKGGNAAIPIVSINSDIIAAEIHRIGDRSMARAVSEGVFLGQLNPYQISQIEGETGEKVWQGEIDVTPKLNEEVTTAIPVGEVIDTLEPGAYAMTAEAKDARGESWGSKATQWFVVSDLGLTALKGNDGLTAVVRALSSAKALSGTKLRLVAVNDEILGTASTDASGVATFQPGLLRGSGGQRPALLVAEGADGDYGFLDLTKAPFDLTDRGVAGRPSPPPLDVFLTTERGIYRPGETVHATALVRDAKAVAVPDLPLTVVFRRPDGVESTRMTSSGAGAGGHAVDLALSPNAMRGTWQVAVYSDPKGSSLSEESFLVEDFQPERIDYDLETDAKAIDPNGVTDLSMEVRYLYGAVAADLAIEGEINVSPSREMDGFKGYKFGLAQESVQAGYQALPEGLRTGADGTATVPVALSDLPSTTGLLKAAIATRVVDAGGRRVERRLELPVRPDGNRIGIKPMFDGSVEEGGNAAFEIIVVAPDGTRIAAEDLKWSLLDIETSYQWYRQNGSWNYEPVTTTRRVETGTVSTGLEDAGRIEMPVKWGRYRLQVESTDGTPIASSVSFDAGWYIAASSSETPDFLRVALDKEKYAIGETARVNIAPRFAGTAMVMVMSDRVLSMQAVEVPEDGTTVELPVTEDWGAGAYVTASLIRPMDLEAKRMPARALGLAHAGVDVGDRDLAVEITAPETLRPRGTLDVDVQIANLAPGSEAFITLAAVDVGILNLTGFKAPAPDDYYFGRRQLGVEIRDLYGQLIDRMQGVPGTIRTGGDGMAGQLQGTPPTEKLMAFFSGIVRLDEDGKTTIPVDIPDFNGTIRLMVQAWTADGVGHGTKEVIARDPIVVAASVPQFLAPGDRSRLLLELTHVEGPAGEVRYSVRTDDKLALTPGTGEGTVTLGETERTEISVPINGTRVGDAGLDVVVTTPDGDLLTKSLTIPVRANEPPVSRRNVVSLAARTGRLTIDGEVLDEFLPGTGSVAVSISGAGALDIPGIVAALDRYPYGCAEQITSRALPLVYLDSVAIAAGLGRDAEVAPRVAEAVKGVLAKQASSGSFGMWYPGSDNLWLDAYVSDFLTRAKEKDYPVPRIGYDLAIDNLSNRLSYATDFEHGGEDVAYALYVLARAGRASIGDLRYYADTKINSFATPLAKAQIGAALALYGDRLRADKAFKAAYADLSRGQDDVRVSRHDYGSDLRDGAGLVTLVAESRSKALDMKRLVAGLAKRSLRSRYTSTQEKAWMLLAANALVETSAKPDLRVDGQSLDRALYARFDADRLTGNPVEVENLGADGLDAVITVSGVPLVPEPAGGNGYRIERAYYTMDGKPLDIAEVKQNTRFVTVLTVTAEADVRGRLLIVDPLPAGIEIDNPNLLSGGSIQALDWLGLSSSADHLEFRADRFVASVDRQPRSPLSFRLAYIARAVSPGSFVHPAALVEDMYRPEQRGRTASGRVDVIGPVR
ncbi:hypothetical protein GGD81_003669 [Rhodobium orientis]|nr:alpha-2-macroglobulin family protein [Rhodobium orientis]MBB4304609.1 hypothetical protein [Rhodobium orientis]